MHAKSAQFAADVGWKMKKTCPAKKGILGKEQQKKEVSHFDTWWPFLPLCA